MAQRLPRDEDQQARYFPAPSAGRDRELYEDEGEMHARAPAVGNDHNWDSGYAWRP